MSDDLTGASATELSDWLASGRVSSRELTEAFLARIGAVDPTLNSVITRCESAALAAADAADARRARGDATALTGLPLLHKDIFCTRGLRTTCASRMLADFVPPYDATVVRKLADAGTVCLGKANLDEFAMGSSNESSWFAPVRNPWNTDCVPGGSSGGSAAAVAAGLTPLATGTDTGGSIRQPASFCGITGLKPTYGRVSRLGIIAFASSLDQAGPMARTAADCALMLSAMAGVDPGDSTSADLPVPDYRAGIDTGIGGLTVGLPRQYFSEQLSPGVRASVDAAVAELEAEGATLTEIDLPHTEQGIAAYYVIAPSEASTNLARYDGIRFGHRCDEPVDLHDLYFRSRSEGFGPEVQRRILVGTYALSAGFYDAYFKKAQQVRRVIADEFARAFAGVDLIAAPAAPGTAFRLGEKSGNADPCAMYREDIYTIPASLAGLPALSLPVAPSGGMPVGLQLIGRPFDELTLLRVGHRLQQRTDWHRARPAITGAGP